MRNILIAAGVATLISGCGSPRLDEPSGETPSREERPPLQDERAEQPFWKIGRSSNMRARKELSLLQRPYEQVMLGKIIRKLPNEKGELGKRDTFLCEPLLILNSRVQDPGLLRRSVEKRKDELTANALKVIYAKPPPFYYGADVYDKLALTLRADLNRSLGRTKDGKWVVDQVVFIQFTAPVH